MSIVHGDEVLVKGAPDAVLPRCSGSATGGARDALHALAGRGLRVLAVASRRLEGGDVPTSADEAEQELDLLGLVALEDPPRHGAGAALGCLPSRGHPCRDDHRRPSRDGASDRGGGGLLGPTVSSSRGKTYPTTTRSSAR